MSAPPSAPPSPSPSSLSPPPPSLLQSPLPSLPPSLTQSPLPSLPPSPSSSPPQHTNGVIAPLIVPVMAALLQLKYQGSNTSPFDTHFAEMFLLVVSFLIYVFSHNALLKITPDSNYYYQKMIHFLASVFGPLTLTSYLSLLFPPLCLILYTISILYSATHLLLSTTR